MTFLSGIFFVFLFVTCLLYFIFPLKARWFVLLLSSVIFYLSWGWQALPVVLVTSLMVYLAARRIDTIYVKQDEDLKREGMTPAEKKECKLRAKKRAKRVHMLVSALVILCMVSDCIAKDQTLEELTLDEFKGYSALFENDIYDAIDLIKCCEGRTSYGGPSEGSVNHQIELANAQLAAWEANNA